MIARFYERFGDHAVNLARRISSLAPTVHGPATDGDDEPPDETRGTWSGPLAT
jgi:phosphate uptake regulator